MTTTPTAIEQQLDNAMSELSEIGDLLRQALDKSNTQVVVHRSEGPGPLLAAAIAVGACTILMQIILMIWLIPEIHDMKAWQDIMRKDIARLQAEKHP